MSGVCLDWETAHVHGEAWISHHRLRHRLFVKRQNWEVPSYNSLEYGEFDTPAAKYLLWLDEKGQARATTRLIPTVFEGTLGDRFFHLNDFLPRSRTIHEAKPDGHICVLGSSQSAVEIVLDLHRRFPQAKITNIMRSFGHQLKDTSPFSEEVYFPDFVDYFFDSTPASKIDLTAELRRTNYSSADRDVIHQFYFALDEQQLDGGERLSLQRNSDITLARLTDQGVELSTIERHRGTARTITADGVLLATGFRNFGPGRDDEQIPKLLSPIHDRLALNNRGFLHVNRDYSLSSSDPDAPLPPIYVNGLCESSHGLGDAGSFSLLLLRSAEVVRSPQSRLRTSVPRTVLMDRVKTVAADYETRPWC